MKRSLRFAALLLGFAALVACATSDSQGQDKKNKKAAKRVLVIEPTEKAGKEWLLQEAKVGVKLMSDRDYYVSALPKEVIGGSYIRRTHAEHRDWLPPASVMAKQNCTAYVMIRVKYIEKDEFNEAAQAKLEKDGWTPVEGKAASSVPGKEIWQWKVWKKDVEEGEITLKLESLKWPSPAVLFFFK